MDELTYLGDSVYACTDGCGGIVLTTRNGLPDDPSNIIYMEPEVIRAFENFLKAARAAREVSK